MEPDALDALASDRAPVKRAEGRSCPRTKPFPNILAL
jgi:hypothetical protein